MTIAIMILVLVNTAAIAYLATVIFEIRDGVQSYYPSLVKIMAEQRDVLQSTLDSINRWSDISADIVDHIERVEDMEGDIKDIFEWIHSVDDNVADMRKDIQLIRDPLTNGVFTASTKKIEKDILEIKEKLSPENYSWDDFNRIIVDTSKYNYTDGDTDGDISIVGFPPIQAEKLNKIVRGDDNGNDNNRTE